LTIKDAITRVDMTKPNQFGPAIKITWLSELDGKIFEEIFKTHEESPIEKFEGHTSEDDELLIPFPYDSIYLRWLETKIDYANGETNKYNVSNILFNSEYSQMRNHYNRNHNPIGTRIKFF
jgi:hypothetical protein